MTQKEVKLAHKNVRKAFCASKSAGEAALGLIPQENRLKVIAAVFRRDLLNVIMEPAMAILLFLIFIGIILLILAVVFLFTGLYFGDSSNFSSKGLRIHKCPNIAEYFADISLNLPKNEIGNFISVSWIGRFSLYFELKAIIDANISRQLLVCTAEEARLWHKDALKWTRNRARYSKKPMMRVAALLLLSDLGDPSVSKLAQNASRSTDERVRAAAEDVLRVRGGTARDASGAGW
jgi:hypothetical protein